MKRIKINTKLRDNTTATLEGWVPYPDCPLAVTRPMGNASSKQWTLTHVQSGARLGGLLFATRAHAAEFLRACQPEDPAWRETKHEKDYSALHRRFELTTAARAVVRVNR